MRISIYAHVYAEDLTVMIRLYIASLAIRLHTKFHINISFLNSEGFKTYPNVAVFAGIEITVMVMNDTQGYVVEPRLID